MPGVSVTETLRRAIMGASVSRYAIAKATGIEQSALSRFIHGERGLDGTSIDKLAAYFSLELLPAQTRKKGPIHQPPRKETQGQTLGCIKTVRIGSPTRTPQGIGQLAMAAPILTQQNGS